MNPRNGLKFVFLFGLLLLTGTATEAIAGQVTYSVTMDTTGFTGDEGYLDIQLGTAGDNVVVQAVIDGFTTDGTLSGSTDDSFSTGAATVSGSLPGQLTLFNDDSAAQTAYASQYFSAFGNTISFLLKLDGDSIGASSVSMPSFAISLFGGDPDYLPYFSGSDGQNNAAIFIQANGDGTVTATTYAGVSPNNADAPMVQLIPAVQAVPEPATLTLLTVGLSIGSLVALGRRRRITGR